MDSPVKPDKKPDTSVFAPVTNNTNSSEANTQSSSARAIMVSADMQRMQSLLPINSNTTVISASTAINSSNWLNKFFVNRKILDSDYCVE